MGFVYKTLDQAEMDQLSSKVRGPSVLLQDGYVIDEQAGIALISLGSTSYGREDYPVTYLNLLWGENTITIEASKGFEKDDIGSVLVFQITKLAVPSGLHLDIELVRKTIEAAAAAYWGTLLRRSVHTRVSLPTTIDRF